MDLSPSSFVRALRTRIAALPRRHFAVFLVFVAAALLAGACNSDNVLAPGSEPVAPQFDVLGAATPGQPQVAAGYEHSCAVLGDGSLDCWGRDNIGQSTPPAGTYTQVSAEQHHSCAVRTDGEIRCWGGATYRAAIPTGGSYKQVSTKYYNACALKTDGGIACWGGNGTPPVGSYTQVTAGVSHACALKTDGGLACWGASWAGTNIAHPEGTFTQVSAGYHHNCAVRTDTSIVCWGNDWTNAPWGQVNTGMTKAPTGSYTQVSAGALHSCAVKTDGGIVCWGTWVNLGPTPAGTFTQVSMGLHHACAVRTTGAIVCWGNNSFGQSTPQDQDGDGVLDNADNCPTIANADQADSDGDGIGDACANQAPVANAGGPYSILTSSASLALDGSASSDPDAGDAIASYVWDFNSTTLATGAIVTVPASSLNAAGISAAGTYTLRLTVTDSRGTTGSATATLTVVSDADGDGIPDASDNCPAVANADQSDVDGDGIGDACDDTDDRNQAPVANAGPDQTLFRTSASGVEVTLDGTVSSDAEGAIAAYSWSRNGTVIGTGATPKVLFALGSHNVKLVVTDDGGLTAEDFVTITVNNRPPVANAGADQTLFRTSPAGVEVTLNGSASSDADGTIASYSWSENGSTFATGATPSHVFGLGMHVVKLVVTDNDGSSAEDFVTITVNNRPPTAFVANAIRTLECVNNGAVAGLDGSGSSDVDGTIATYVWTSAAGGTTGALTSLALPLGITGVSLTVTDNDGATDQATATITVQDTRPPAITMLVSPTELWPPNARMIQVASGISAADECDPSPSLGVTVSSNEPASPGGDWSVVANPNGTYDVYVRAERSEDGTGRIYTITATAGDASGNVSSQTGTVTVPHNPNPNRGRPRNGGK